MDYVTHVMGLGWFNQVDLDLDSGFTWNNDDPVEHRKYQTGKMLSAYRSKNALGPFRS